MDLRWNGFAVRYDKQPDNIDANFNSFLIRAAQQIVIVFPHPAT